MCLIIKLYSYHRNQNNNTQVYIKELNKNEQLTYFQNLW